MSKDQLFIDLSHMAYSGYVPKQKLDEMIGKPSWDANDSGIYPDFEPLELDNDLPNETN